MTVRLRRWVVALAVERWRRPRAAPGARDEPPRPGLLGRLVSDWGGWCLCGVAVAAPGQESVEGALEGVCDVDLAALDVELRDPPTTPVYQRIAAEAAELRTRGATFHAIAEHFGVDDHTAADAVRWFHGEL